MARRNSREKKKPEIPIAGPGEVVVRIIISSKGEDKYYVSIPSYYTISVGQENLLPKIGDSLHIDDPNYNFYRSYLVIFRQVPLFNPLKWGGLVMLTISKKQD